MGPRFAKYWRCAGCGAVWNEQRRHWRMSTGAPGWKALLARQSRVQGGRRRCCPGDDRSGIRSHGVLVMPHLPLPACRFPRCSGRGSHRGYCAEHAAQCERACGSAAARGYDAAWSKVRAKHLKAYPWCVECGLEATDVDHIVSVKQAPQRRLDLTVLRSHCHQHHSQRTANEQSGW